jgi:hypothetical protein
MSHKVIRTIRSRQGDNRPLHCGGVGGELQRAADGRRERRVRRGPAVASGGLAHRRSLSAGRPPDAAGGRDDARPHLPALRPAGDRSLPGDDRMGAAGPGSNPVLRLARWRRGASPARVCGMGRAGSGPDVGDRSGRVSGVGAGSSVAGGRAIPHHLSPRRRSLPGSARRRSPICHDRAPRRRERHRRRPLVRGRPSGPRGSLDAPARVHVVRALAGSGTRDTARIEVE